MCCTTTDPDMWLKGAALFRATVHTMCFVVRAVVKSNAKKIATRDTEKKDLQQMLQVCTYRYYDLSGFLVSGVYLVCTVGT